MSYRSTDDTVAYEATRITVRVSAPFDEVRARFETAVPPLDPADLDAVVSGRVAWEDFIRGLAWEAPNGFVRVATDDLGRVLGVAGGTAATVSYAVLDWAAAGRIHRLEPSALVYLPLRMLLASRADHVALTFDQPSSQLTSFGLNKLTQAGRELDRRLADLLEEIDIPRPAALGR
ncbi:hypothetical protein [Microbacterium sp. P04]|uniref:hypothetical protein n=1 Tax=Microbacterium sp. P04 TaxID=3366947 RepID=UPI00374607CC